LNNYIEAGIVPEATTYQLLFTNHFDFAGNKLPFDTANGMIRPGGLFHIEKPISDFSDLLTIRKILGSHHLSLGSYFAYYTQSNAWYISDILTDVRDNPRFVDLLFIQPDGSLFDVTKNGFRHFLSFYLNGEGDNTLFAFFTSDQFKLSDRLRIDLGLRYESNNYFQVVENVDLIDPNDPNTRYDDESWGNETFRRFDFNIDDLAYSAGVNFQLIQDRLAVYGSFTRGFKMPALDEFLFEQNEEFAKLFKPYNTNMFEVGVKYSAPLLAFSGAFYYGRVYNQILRDVRFDDGVPTFITIPLPESTSWGMEFEILTQPMDQLELRSTATFVEVDAPPEVNLTGQFYDGFTPAVFDFEASYFVHRNTQLMFDWHYVGSRFSDSALTRRLNAYGSINIGTSHQFTGTRFTITARVLNLTQSKGLEEEFFFENQSSEFFVARPILPRRFTVEVRYDF
jgi:outer membrane receptor protein involved in Fe transport